MSDTKAKALEIFNASVAEGKKRDLVIIDMVVGGISLNSAQNYYKEFAQEAGLTSGRVASRKNEALEWLATNDYDLQDRESRSNVRKMLQEQFSVKEGTANDYIKAFAEEQGIELPTAGPRSADSDRVFQFIRDNFDSLDKPTFKEFMEGLGRAQGSIDETWRGVVLARRLMAEGVSYSEAA